MKQEGQFLPYSISELPSGPWLVFAPHADDETFGMGGALALAAQHAVDVRLVVLTDGAMGGEADRQTLIETREAEARAAADRLAIAQVMFWREPDRGLRDSDRLRRRIVDLLEQTLPASVFFPSPMEPHPDHRAAAHLVWDALESSAHRAQAYSYEITVQGQINRLLDISDVMSVKRQAMACYGSQLQENQYADLVLALNRTRTFSLDSQVEYAEGLYAYGDASGALAARVAGQLKPYWSLDSTVRPPLVSVIIRTKDRPEGLRKALNSVVAQDYPEIEVVIVNDGEQDIDPGCRGMQSNLTALRIVRPQQGGGRIRAANTGLEAATGAYIQFLDDDDWLYSDHLHKLVSALESDPAAGLVYTGVECRQRDENGELSLVHLFNQPFERTFLLLRNFIPIHAAMFRRIFVDEGMRLDESLTLYEDWDFWVQIAARTQFRYVPGISACYCLGPEGGFGVQSDAGLQLSAQDLFFDKWRKLWSAANLREIVDYARQVPGLRQLAHEAETARNELSAQQQESSVRHASEIQHLKAQGEAQSRSYAESLQIERTEKADLEQRLEQQCLLLQQSEQGRELFQNRCNMLEQSTSWRVTAPLRFLVLSMRQGKHKAGRAMKNNRLRLANAMSILRKKGLRGYIAYAKKRFVQQAAEDGEPAHVSSEEQPAQVEALQVNHIKPADYKTAAENIRLPFADTPQVSVVIPVYNHLGHTLACLSSIAEHVPEKKFEVIVVDDASSDESAAVLSRISGVRYLCNEKNRGFVHTCNYGAQQAWGDYLLFLNNDTQVLPGWLDALAETLEQMKEAGIAGSKLIYPSGYLQEAGANLHRDGSVTLVGLNGDPRDPRYNYLREVDHCSGASLMIRRDLFEQLGGFDVRYAPAYFEDCDLSLRVREQGFKVYYQPASQVMHHLSVTTDGMNQGKMAQIERNREIYLERWGEYLHKEDRVRLITFYLPQYHPIPENDEWWGKGFTEWSNVTKAKPSFEHHYQPQLPSDLGFYDLRLADAREEQARLAREYGVYGFCYYYYWFDGKRLLDRPLKEVLESGQPDFPFCVCWANENWTRRWDGRDSEILISQNYTDESNRHFIADLLPAFSDARYIRVDGKPMLLIYRAEQIPDLAHTLTLWRKEARESGVGELYLVAVESFTGMDNETEAGFDATVEFPPHGRAVAPESTPSKLNPGFSGNLYDYKLTADNFMHRIVGKLKLFRSAMPSWDNTARRQDAADIFVNSSPEYYRHWLSHIVKETRNTRMGDERLVFVNAWNEWAEGNHLEPDKRYGHAYLQATRDALGDLGRYGGPGDSRSGDVLNQAGDT